ncbi:MAG: Lrp/AsnC family transcriptional regulator [Oligoflexia bacterium]|nr:Lrp/AsnC family transcriptional regulator [Oligoflexia bacterium]
MDIELDKIDRRILSELSQDCRPSLSALSTALGLNRDRVKYRIAKLEECGVVTKYAACINPYKFGVCLYKTYFRLENDKQRINSLVGFLDRHPRTYWLAESYGTWDLMVATFAKSPKEFHTIQDSILSKYSDIILGFSVYVLIDVWYFSRVWLSGFSVDQFFFGGEPQNNSVSELDFGIMRMLVDNARTPITSIAERLGCAAETVRYRIKKLEQLGIIAGYRVELDLSKLGRDYFKAQIHLSQYIPRLEDELRAYCKSNPCILHFIKQIGDCKLELELEVEGFAQYNQLMDEIREKFKGYVRNIETIVIRTQRFKGVPADMEKISSTGQPE